MGTESHMNEKDENTLLKIIMDMTPLTNYIDLKTWYSDFKRRIGKATKPDIKFVDKIDEQIEQVKKRAVAKKKRGKKNVRRS